MKKELELYIHIPFCVRKCAYCDFLSAPATEEVQREYVEALKQEIRESRKLAETYEVSTVFFELVPIGLPLVMQALSILMGLVQALVFSLLTAIYIHEAMPEEEEHL